MNERLKIIRKHFGLNTRDFGARLGMSNGAISLLESGKRNITLSFVLSVCREFNINEEWFQTGEGEMFSTSTREDEIAKITAQMFKADESDFRWQLQKLVSQMSDEQIKVFHDFAIMLAESINK